MPNFQTLEKRIDNSIREIRAAAAELSATYRNYNEWDLQYGDGFVDDLMDLAVDWHLSEPHRLAAMIISAEMGAERTSDPVEALLGCMALSRDIADTCHSQVCEFMDIFYRPEDPTRRVRFMPRVLPKAV